jgi:hypothetical protein
MLATALALTARSAHANNTCDPDFVTHTGVEFTVKPTGVNDTVNLQCAFDKAVAIGANTEVHLSSGVFHTAQIMVYGFQGQFTGEGVKNSIVTNLPNLPVTPVDVFNNPPSTDNLWPSLFAFVDGDFSITDLTIHIAGDDLTTGWTIFNIDPPFEELAHAIVITGTHANVRIENFLLEGERMEDSAFGYNVLNGIFYEGVIGEIPPPLSGSYRLSNSTIRTIAFSTPVSILSEASVVVRGNQYEDTFLAMDASDIQNSTLEFSHNKIDGAIIGFDLWNLFAPEFAGSTFLIQNNVIQGEIGIAFEQTFGTENRCLLQGNNVQNVTDLGIYLGPGTTGCTVIAGSNKTNVLDLGTDNILVGVNNMGARVGLDAKTFMSRRP